ncbi:helix-turn-helix domain-containing protein [Sporosarcina sp. FSL K6-1508]|uniref:helix-turn-helix domain-containing protein n=1 Tax=Sporosarcina sp. FSL K6-1508 TaxID=2921553 RepID=UPI0030F63057
MKMTLRAARVNAGMTLVASSKQLSVNKDTLSKYERDSSNIPRSLLVKIENLYNVNANDIFFGNESEFFRIKRKVTEKV